MRLLKWIIIGLVPFEHFGRKLKKKMEMKMEMKIMHVLMDNQTVDSSN